MKTTVRTPITSCTPTNHPQQRGTQQMITHRTDFTPHCPTNTYIHIYTHTHTHTHTHRHACSLAVSQATNQNSSSTHAEILAVMYQTNHQILVAYLILSVKYIEHVINIVCYLSHANKQLQSGHRNYRNDSSVSVSAHGLAPVKSRGRQVSPFHRPRRALGRVQVQLYSI